MENTKRKNSFSRIITTSACNFRRWKRNPRIIFTFLFAFILCFMLSNKVMQFSQAYETNLQIAEAFIWTFDGRTALMLASLLLIFMLGDMPFLGSNTPYFLIRTNRREWLCGQILYIIAVVFIYCVFVFLSTAVLCMTRSFVGNMWSETAALIAFTESNAALEIPVSIKTLEMTTPYECMLVVFLLMLCYSLLLMLIMLYFNIAHGRTAGFVAALGFSLYGYILEPDFIQELLSIPEKYVYEANVAAGWLSPLNHATYHMHNFGYDYLPTLWQTYLIFFLLMGFFFLMTLKAIKRYNFNFSQGSAKFMN